MALKSWPLSVYTPGNWTNLVTGDINGNTVRGLNICNTTVSPITLSVRVATSGGVNAAAIISATVVPAGKSYLLDTDPINLTGGQLLQINASAIGLEFFASGVSY